MLQRYQSNLGATELAKALGVSRQSVYRSEKAGRIKRKSNGLFDLAKVRTDWVNSTGLKMNGSSRMLSEPKCESEPSEHPALTFFQSLWGASLRTMALCLRDKGQLSAPDCFDCLSVLFFVQWEIISQDLELPEGHLMKFTGPMEKLITLDGKGTLEKWLDDQPHMNWEG